MKSLPKRSKNNPSKGPVYTGPNRIDPNGFVPNNRQGRRAKKKRRR